MRTTNISRNGRGSDNPEQGRIGQNQNIGKEIYYNNGKIKIGSAYYLNPLKPKYVEQDPDMLLIQKYLISDPALLRKERLITLVFELFGVFILLVIFLKGIS